MTEARYTATLSDGWYVAERLTMGDGSISLLLYEPALGCCDEANTVVDWLNSGDYTVEKPKQKKRLESPDGVK